jgi:hypothetical protein
MIPFYLRRLRVSRRVDACCGNHRYAKAAAPVSLTANQLRVVLRAIANLDPYTFADGIAEDIADEKEPRSVAGNRSRNRRRQADPRPNSQRLLSPPRLALLPPDNILSMSA